MRTKSLILAAALGVAGALSGSAQSTNVYSVNAVGYISVTIPANKFKMIANQLNAPVNTIGNILTNVPDGAQFFRWNGAGYDTYDFILGLGWLPDGNASLAPGQGGFLKNPTGAPITVTFVGEVPQGSLTNSIGANFAVVSSVVPQSGDITTFGYPGADGDQIFQWTGSGYNTFDYINGIGWLPSNPVVAVGEAFFSKKTAGVNWVRTFSANN